MRSAGSSKRHGRTRPRNSAWGITPSVLSSTRASRPTAHGGVTAPKARLTSRSRCHATRIGDVYGLEIVHTDPDGGDYGGHFLIYGRGDDDSTWGRMELTGPIQPIER